MPKPRTEYLDCKFLLDKFCYPIEKKYIGREILIFRKLKTIINIDVLKKIQLTFKIRSLAWFISADGKTFLTKRKLFLNLQKELKRVDYSCQETKFGKDVKIKKRKNLIQIIDE